MFQCIVCRGKGILKKSDKIVRCPHCNGKGETESYEPGAPEMPSIDEEAGVEEWLSPKDKREFNNSK